MFYFYLNDHIHGGPGAIRTPDPFVRSEVLYPTELRARDCGVALGLYRKRIPFGHQRPRTANQFISNISDDS
jgi:hypothetical protein